MGSKQHIEGIHIDKLVEALQKSMPASPVVVQQKSNGLGTWIANQSVGGIVAALGVIFAATAGYVTLSNRVDAQEKLSTELKEQIQEVKKSIDDRNDDLYEELRKSTEATSDMRADVAVIKNDVQTLKSQKDN